MKEALGVTVKAKTCSKCMKVLPLHAFRVKGGRRRGLRADCKACQKKYYDANKQIPQPRNKFFLDMENKRKECSKCRKVLPFDAFTAASKESAGKSMCKSACRACLALRRNKHTSKKNHLKSMYGLTPEQYHVMIEDQNGLCLICETRMKKPNVDHDHGTGLVRGLLCLRCNMGLGLFDDNTGNLIRALDYLNHHRGND